MMIIVDKNCSCSIIHRAWFARPRGAVIGLTEEVNAPLMQRVFGCTGLHCGLHLRKLVVAIDFIDWESAGVSSKLDIKMTKVPAAHVQRSLLTWIPQGERLVMFDTLEELAFVIGSSKKGF